MTVRDVERVQFVNVTEAAGMLLCTRKHVYSLIARGTIVPVRHPLYRSRGPVRIAVEDIQVLQRLLRWTADAQKREARADHPDLVASST